MIKPLLVNTYDPKGGAGAARAAYRLHQELLRLEIDSQMLIQDKRIADSTVISSPNKLAEGIWKARPLLNDLPLEIYRNRQRNPTFFRLQWLPNTVASQIAGLEPDIINLNWICDGFIPIEALAKFNKPIVWTFHDMWAFTGGCCYSLGCDRYTKSCGNCPQLGSKQSWDLSRWVWQRKIKAWQNLKLTIVTPSNWLAECAKSSSLFSNSDIRVIPYGLDINIYKPTNSEIARNLLSLPQNKQLILFGAINGTSNPRKGFELLQSALQKLSESEWKDKIELIVFGSSQPQKAVDLGFKVHYLGKIDDENKLALLYASADVMIVPSIEEAYGLTASESLSCGTPVVSFDSTGLKDIVEHQKNGYRAQCFSCDDLANGIVWVIEDKERHQKLRASAREKAEQEFPLELQAHRYLSLFEEMVTH
ncbi:MULTISPECIES: glycosyltransferase family 4 protein [unclassified Nostoc]|uniref:glycosyltransferase family 4 protein n=1 Tax=unclassified Nostoc TaxID=2593658 RepID=UPI002AD3A69C|nr:glycosyltransferase family 4 protein [Nostoc sp. DedQUE03]MDZ7971681.1 glycosyltransferase family 4 protein [Nostoc sp. DedQUE03]MDZ8048229.1 glycosyltransferase family 4 protein [Nostoc sp. DedQUE02]